MSVPVVAQQLTVIGGMPITNALLTGWVTVGVFVVTAALVARGPKEVPRGIRNAAEAGIEAMLDFMDQVTNDRAKSRRFLPLIGTLFPLILVSNWLGLLPGVGSIGIWGMLHGEQELLPFIRPATSDLNMTLALGITSVVVSHLVGIGALGFFRHWGKFVQIRGVGRALMALLRHPSGDTAIGVFAAFVEFGSGLIELVSEAAKMISLSLRLFGNIFAGEVLLHVLTSLVPYLLPVPFLFMEVIVGVVQALVFSILVLVYLTLATEPPHGEADAHGSSAVPAHA
jgi:F-type H+-transporting ATPase subunit a